MFFNYMFINNVMWSSAVWVWYGNFITPLHSEQEEKKPEKPVLRLVVDNTKKAA